MTGQPLDDMGRYSQTVIVGEKFFEPKYFSCATTECLRTAANLDMNDPATQAYVKALDAQVFKDIGEGTTLGSLVTPVGVSGAVLGITGFFAGLGESAVQGEFSEGLRDEAIKTLSTTGATAFFRDVLGHSAAASARAVAVIDLTGGWDAFVERVKVDLLGCRRMQKCSKAITTWLVLAIFTYAVYVTTDLDTAWKRLLPAVLVGITWNLYAYAVDRGMWPRQFAELDGYGKGHPTTREVVFWASAAVYLLLLAAIVLTS